MTDIENKKDTYAFWDLMAEHSYQTEIDYLKKRGIAKFNQEDTPKNIYLFGCNDASATFYKLYNAQYHFKGVFDNAETKHGTKFMGLPILCPNKIISELDPQNNTIIIAMRLSGDIIARQLDMLGFRNYYSLAVLLSEMEPYSSWIKKMEQLENYPVQDIVFFESTGDFDGNSGALYNYLKERGSRHKFVWILKKAESKRLLNDTNDVVLCPNDNPEDLKRYVELRAVAKWLIWDNKPIRKVREEQINVFLQHFGMGYKQIDKWYRAPDYIDYVLTTNEFVHSMEQGAICYPSTAKILYGELPRNDVLHEAIWDELSKLIEKTYKRTVIWAPTLRESTTGNRKDSDIDYPFGISLIYEETRMSELNDELAKLDMLLIIKPHPHQKLNFIESEYSNIIYLNMDRMKQIHTYKLLTQMDAMITDYSSIVFDYMLLDRPIAWVLEDREHYKIEYLMDNPEEYMPGEKIYTFDDLLHFLMDVNSGKDSYKEARRKICAKCNPPFEGRGCERLAEALGL